MRDVPMLTSGVSLLGSLVANDPSSRQQKLVPESHRISAYVNLGHLQWALAN